MILRTDRRSTILLLALALSACGANGADDRATARPADPPATTTAAAEPDPEPSPEPTAEAQPEPTPEPAPPPQPEAVAVEAGQRLGPIRIGMSRDEVGALGLAEGEPDEPDSERFGIYRVFFDDDGVRRVEAEMGDLGRIRFGDQVIASGTHIHQIRDAFGHCEWYEGGGERYRCDDRTLFVHTTHTMDPAHYTVAVQRP